MQTDLRLGAKVEGQKGQALGEIRHLMMDADRKQVTHIVVGGPPHEQRLTLVELAKIGEIADNKGAVQLNLTKEQFTQLPEFDEHKFVQERGYPSEPHKTHDSNGNDSQPAVTGGYSVEPDANFDAPGLADSSSKNV